MKSATEMPKYNANMFINKTNDFLEAQLLYASIELDLYKHLEMPVTINEIAKQTRYHIRNLELMLNALTSMDFLKKIEGKYTSTAESNYYLNSKNEMYLGDHILYWRDMTNLDNVVNLVKHGPSERTFSDENGSDFFDFRSMGQGARNVMYMGRIQNFILTLQSFFEKDISFKTLDMGAGSGIMSIEIVRNFPNASAVVFDQPRVIELTKEIIKEYGVEDRIKTQVGNFITDSFQGQYDLIIASGVLDFAGDLDVILSKLEKSLAENGYIYIVTHGINNEFTAPKSCILGWLSSHLNGLNILKSDPHIRQSIVNAGFEIVYEAKNRHNYIISKKQ